MNSSFETTWVGMGDSTPFFSSRLNFGIHIFCLRREIIHQFTRRNTNELALLLSCGLEDCFRSGGAKDGMNARSGYQRLRDCYPINHSEKNDDLPTGKLRAQ